jgi:hypothetical protein
MRKVYGAVGKRKTNEREKYLTGDEKKPKTPKKPTISTKYSSDSLDLLVSLES